MTNRPHLLSSTLSTLLVTMLLLSWDPGPSPAPGLALAVGPAPGDDPTLPPLSAVLRRESYEMIDTLADPATVLDPPPGGMIQDDIGALDLDQGSKHIWAAGYAPIIVGGGDPRNYFYLVNRNNGKIIQSCYIPANVTNGLGFNDSLTYARLTGLPGSGEYLMTDSGEFFAGAPLKVSDTASCHDGKDA